MRRIPRRDFLRGAAAIAAGRAVPSCTDTFAPVRPRFGKPSAQVDTRWPIKRVVYLMLENRSFANLFAGFPRVTRIHADLGQSQRWESPVRGVVTSQVGLPSFPSFSRQRTEIVG